MNFNLYTQLFQEVLEGVASVDYPANRLEYIALNQSRQNRWLKKMQIVGELKERMQQIKEPQTWVVITEPWCGDAAHSVPFIYAASEIQPLVALEIQLRDQDSEIDHYLTNGNAGIPKLIVRNAAGEDLFTWGPRPASAQSLFEKVREEKGADEAKIALQHWYNADKGESLQRELLELLKSVA